MNLKEKVAGFYEAIGHQVEAAYKEFPQLVVASSPGAGGKEYRNVWIQESTPDKVDKNCEKGILKTLKELLQRRRNGPYLSFLQEKELSRILGRSGPRLTIVAEADFSTNIQIRTFRSTKVFQIRKRKYSTKQKKQKIF